MSGTIVFALRQPWTPSTMADHLADVVQALSFTWSADEPTDLYVEIDMSVAGALNAVKRAVSEADPCSTCRFTDEVSNRLLDIIVNHGLTTSAASGETPMVGRPEWRPRPADTAVVRSAVLFATFSTERPDATERESRTRRFARSRREAHHAQEEWFALSSHYGLVPHDAPSLANLDMRPIPHGHRQPWASWVAIRLEAALGTLDGARIRIDAPMQYDDLLRPELVSRGAIVADLPH